MNIAAAFPISPLHEQIAAVTTSRTQPYIPPEANWEARIPHLPVSMNHQYKPSDDIDLSSSDLSETHKHRLKEIIIAHNGAFVGPDGHLGHYNGPIRHRIELVDEPARKIYRVPLEKRQEIERQVIQMLNDGIIRESASPFCAPIVLVKKRDANSWRFTIDFRGQRHY